jgi:hypothetical protein
VMGTFRPNTEELVAIKEGIEHDTTCGMRRPFVAFIQTCARRNNHAGSCMDADYLQFLTRAATGEDFPYITANDDDRRRA